MLECLIIGDSIAVGLQPWKPECTLIGRQGINSWQFNRSYIKLLDARTVVIALGTNDHFGVNSYNELSALRKKLVAERVYWVLPSIRPNVQEIIKRIAGEYGDITLTVPSLQKDRMHPSWEGARRVMDQVQ